MCLEWQSPEEPGPPRPLPLEHFLQHLEVVGRQGFTDHQLVEAFADRPGGDSPPGNDDGVEDGSGVALGERGHAALEQGH